MKARLPEGYNMKQGDMMRKMQKMQEYSYIDCKM